ncbi:MAG: DUF2203 domain-containing protein [Myxococcales bacterium]|nr:DUF2203 domain-containing protein [Myxococcales bacterium]
MALPRVFTLAEVDALIPRLTELVAEQMLRQSAVEESLAELARLAGGLPRTIESADDDSLDVARLKAELRARIKAYDEGWREVQSLGAVVKDPQIGLLDFYGRVEGKLVWLCWRYGEESLRYWHELDSGYSGRRPLRNDTRERLWN